MTTIMCHFKKLCKKRKKEEEINLSEKLEQSVSIFVRVSFPALGLLHGGPMKCH